jgi:hypothetical protein
MDKTVQKYFIYANSIVMIVENVQEIYKTNY